MSKPKYTRELLTRAAAEATSMVDLMYTLGAPMGSGPRCYLSKRLRHYGINTSHFREVPLPDRERRSYPQELLSEAAAHASSSWSWRLIMSTATASTTVGRTCAICARLATARREHIPEARAVLPSRRSRSPRTSKVYVGP